MACRRFVRREKEIAMARCDASEGEVLRYKQRVEHQDRELKDLQEAVNAEREKMQVGNEKDDLTYQLLHCFLDICSDFFKPLFGCGTIENR